MKNVFSVNTSFFQHDPTQGDSRAEKVAMVTGLNKHTNRRMPHCAHRLTSLHGATEEYDDGIKRKGPQRLCDTSRNTIVCA